MIKYKFGLRWKNDVELIAEYPTLEAAYEGLKEVVSANAESHYDDFEIIIAKLEYKEPISTFLEHEL